MPYTRTIIANILVNLAYLVLPLKATRNRTAAVRLYDVSQVLRAEIDRLKAGNPVSRKPHLKWRHFERLCEIERAGAFAGRKVTREVWDSVLTLIARKQASTDQVKDCDNG